MKRGKLKTITNEQNLSTRAIDDGHYIQSSSEKCHGKSTLTKPDSDDNRNFDRCSPASDSMVTSTSQFQDELVETLRKRGENIVLLNDHDILRTTYPVPATKTHSDR